MVTPKRIRPRTARTREWRRWITRCWRRVARSCGARLVLVTFCGVVVTSSGCIAPPKNPYANRPWEQGFSVPLAVGIWEADGPQHFAGWGLGYRGAVTMVDEGYAGVEAWWLVLPDGSLFQARYFVELSYWSNATGRVEFGSLVGVTQFIGFGPVLDVLEEAGLTFGLWWRAAPELGFGIRAALGCSIGLVHGTVMLHPSVNAFWLY